MRCQLRSVLAANQAAPRFIVEILEQVKELVSSTDELLVLSEKKQSEQQLKSWATAELGLLPVNDARLAKAIICLRARAAALQPASAAGRFGT